MKHENFLSVCGLDVEYIVYVRVCVFKISDVVINYNSHMLYFVF